MDIQRLDSSAPDFDTRLGRLLDRAPAQDAQVMRAVEQIVTDVRTRGDAALLEYTNRFDHSAWTSAPQLELGRAELDAAWQRLSAATDAYKALPMEADAFELGREVERVFREGR